METLLLFGGLVLVFGVVAFWLGRSKAHEKQARKSAEVKDAQIKAEQGRPRTRDELADRILRDDE